MGQFAGEMQKFWLNCILWNVASLSNSAMRWCPRVSRRCRVRSPPTSKHFCFYSTPLIMMKHHCICPKKWFSKKQKSFSSGRGSNLWCSEPAHFHKIPYLRFIRYTVIGSLSLALRMSKYSREWLLLPSPVLNQLILRAPPFQPGSQCIHHQPPPR